MNLVRRSTSPLSLFRPATAEDQFGRIVESMFDEFLSPFAPGIGRGMPALAEGGAISPRVEVNETEKAYEVQAEMPGVKKEDLKVSIDHDRVTIEGECRKATERREGETVVYSERTTGRYMRSFLLPTEVDDTTAQAKLEDGILSLTLPKKAGAAAHRLTIQ